MIFGEYLPEMAVTVTYTSWLFICWFAGHVIYLMCSYCKEGGLIGCAGSDPIGIITLLLGSIVYCRIMRHILKFFYKGELPADGNEILGKILKSMNSNGSPKTKQPKKK
jgi:hypothetical protein